MAFLTKTFLFSLLLPAFTKAAAQSYADSIYQYRIAYRNEFLKDEHSPLKQNDTAFLRFFAPDKQYRTVARVAITPEKTTFQMPTHSGKNKPYRKFGYLNFTLNGKHYTLEVYQSLDLLKNEQYKDYLFVPFKDETNYEETYGGGRYIDLSLKDIRNHTIVLDFNKSYNPYCAYASGYSCPIPPDANRLPLKIKAGEKMFGKKPEE